jgi:hypothetical protein
MVEQGLGGATLREGFAAATKAGLRPAANTRRAGEKVSTLAVAGIYWRVFAPAWLEAGSGGRRMDRDCWSGVFDRRCHRRLSRGTWRSNLRLLVVALGALSR